MEQRVVFALGPVVAMFAAAWLVLRLPDLGQTAAFFTASIPTVSAGEAAMTMLAWIVVITATCLGLVGVARQLRRSRSQNPAPIAWVFLVTGLTLLAVGAVHHALPSPSVCCGSGSEALREAIQLAR